VRRVTSVLQDDSTVIKVPSFATPDNSRVIASNT
jgi:hypothetical protein